jgi:Flp pilus assembly protein TadD
VLELAAGPFTAFAIEPVRRLITIPKIILIDYPKILLFPFRLDYDPRTPLAGSLGEPTVLIGLGLMVVVLSAIVRLARTRPAGDFGLLWYLLLFIPASNIVPIYPGAAHAELFTPVHFLYAPSIGFFLCAAMVSSNILSRDSERELRLRRAAVIPLCGVVLMFSLLSLMRNTIWRDELRLYEYIVRMHPENHRMRVNLGNIYVERNRPDEAIEELQTAVTMAPNIAWYRNSLALAYRARGWDSRAIDEFLRSLELKPESAKVYVSLSALYHGQGKLREAIEAARTAAELDPGAVEALTGLAVALKESGDLAGARNLFEEAIRINPDSAAAHNGLGAIYALEGRGNLARKEWERALEIQPDFDAARENLLRLERMHD